MLSESIGVSSPRIRGRILTVPAIDKGIPIPPLQRRGRGKECWNLSRSPWRQMEVGDSFVFPRGNYPDVSAWRMGATSAVCSRNKRGRGQFLIRMLDGVPRIWRIS